MKEFKEMESDHEGLRFEMKIKRKTYLEKVEERFKRSNFTITDYCLITELVNE